ncbi:MAG: hypothetical protein RJA70_998 [Pseudomonadota bacterium]|jgi:hypothetical protein
MSETRIAQLIEELGSGHPITITNDGFLMVIVPKDENGSAVDSTLFQRSAHLLVELTELAGGIALRGFRVDAVEDYEKLMVGAFGLKSVYAEDTSKSRVLAQADREYRANGSVLNLPSAQPELQGPHIELGWRTRRARYLSIWAETPPQVAGETALFDMNAVYLSLDEDIRRMFDRYPSMYPAYGERIWLDSVLVHPRTQKRCLHLWYYESPLADLAVESYKKTEHYKQSTVQDVKPMVALNSPLKHQFLVDDKLVSLTDEQKRRMLDCAYSHAQYWSWKKGDVLLIDNISLAHGRMPSVPPRRLVGGYWNETDTRAYGLEPGASDDCVSVRELKPSVGMATKILGKFVTGRLRV